MRIYDKSLRHQAIPYYGQVFGYNHSENSDQDISKTLLNPGTFGPTNDPSMSGAGDLYNLINNVSQTDYMVRILRPKFGQIVQAYLTVGITFAAAETSPKFNISVGNSFTGLSANVSSSTYIAHCMNILNPPTSNPFTGVAGQPLTLTVNIEPLIPQVGATNYVADFYSIGLHFLTAPTMSGLYHLSKFFVTGSVMVV